jgi:LysM repeat protein
LLPPTPVVVPTLTPTTCDQPPGWTSYVVQPGDTLLGIARAAQTTLADLRNANCIGDGDFVTEGRVLFVPRPIAGPEAFTPSDDVVFGGVIGCTNTNVSIQMQPDSAQPDVFTLVGSAIVGNFWYYEVSVRPNGSDEASLYKTSFTPVINDAIAQINTTFFGSGRHWVRVEAFDLSGTVPLDASCEVLFQFP